MDRPVRRCSFCRRPQGEVRLVAGPSDVYICHRCVAQCAEILALEEPTDRPGSPEPPGPGTDRLIPTEVISS